MSNLFVGGLPYSVCDDRLVQVFEAVGPVKTAKVITDRESGRSKGFGFVEFEKRADSEEAVRKLDGTELDGRRIKVAIAEERKPRPRPNFR